MGYMGCTAEGYADYLAWLAGEVPDDVEFDDAGEVIESEPKCYAERVPAIVYV